MQDFKPIEYLEFKKDDILSELKEGFLFKDGVTIKVYEHVISILNKLVDVRNSKVKSESLINEISELDIDIANAIKEYLLRSIREDKTFVYAYNKLIHWYNKQVGFIQYEPMILSDEELMELLQMETKDNQYSYSHNYTASEYALAYLFDLDVQGKQIPMNRIEGGYNKKELENIGNNRGWRGNGDTFYRRVKYINDKIDRNNPKDLATCISKNWRKAVKDLSENWELLESYLKAKNI